MIPSMVGIFIVLFGLSAIILIASYLKVIDLRGGQTMIAIVAGVSLLSLCYFWYQSGAEEEKKAEEATKQQKEEEKKASVAKTKTVEVLKLRVDRYTPFSEKINYVFELETQGDSISLHFPTVNGDTTITYTGKGDIYIPPRTRVEGDVDVTSKTRGKETRVKIYEVLTITQ